MSHKRKDRGKKSKGRRGSKPRGAGKGRGSPPGATPLPPGRLVPMLVEAKVGLLRLVRALDAAGVNPGEHPGLPDALAACAQLNDLLTPSVEFYDREPPGEDEPVAEEMQQVLAASSELLGRVLGLFPSELRKRVRRELGRVGAADPEIWLEVEGLRAAGQAAEPTPEELGRQQEEAAYLYEIGSPEDLVDERVARQEAKDLPTDYGTSAWLESLPVEWLRTIARMHRVDPAGKKASLVARIEEALLDPERLATVLAEGLGYREHGLLAAFVADEETLLRELSEDERWRLRVPWDCLQGLPSGIGGRLRVFGLIYVGMGEDGPVASVPPELCGPIVTALKTADPKGWRGLDADLREELELIEGDEPIDDEHSSGREEEGDGRKLELTAEALAEFLDLDPELLSWRNHAHRVLDVLANHFESIPPPADAAERLFAPLRAVRPICEDDVNYIIHLVLFGWRSEPGGKTAAESLLARPQGLEKKEVAILEARCKERTALYRVETVLDGEGAEVVDAFTGGRKRKVDGPELALAFEVGDLIPARLFQAGPYCLFDVVAEPVHASKAGEALAWMEEQFREYAKEQGTMDREAFLRERPECVVLASLRLVELETDEYETDEAGDADLVEPRPPGLSKRPPKRGKPEKIYVLDVELVDSEPPVTRRMQVSGRVLLGDLHDLLQDVMGWHDEHLHAFEARDGSWRYVDLQREDREGADERMATLDEVAPRKGSRFFYQYDFGDCWVHEIRVAERLDPKKAGPHPRCLGGQNACPPEDSGGVRGYARWLEAMRDPDHSEHEQARRWRGDDFDPTHFDPEEVNRHFEGDRKP